jgi:hypothetical protein
MLTSLVLITLLVTVAAIRTTARGTKEREDCNKTKKH